MTDPAETSKVTDRDDPAPQIPREARTDFGSQHPFSSRDHHERKLQEQSRIQMPVVEGSEGEAKKAVSAFRLGYHATILPRQTLVMLEPLVHEVYGLVNMIPAVIKKIEKAVCVLAPLTNTEDESSLRKAIEANLASNGSLVEFLMTAGTPNEDLNNGIWASLLTHKKLLTAADRLLPRGHILRSLYAIGVQIAMFEIEATRAVEIEGPISAACPDIRPLAVRAAKIPDQFLIFSSLLEALAGLVPFVRQNPHPAGLCKFYEDHEAHWVDAKGLDGGLAVVQMTDAMFRRIELDLAVIADEDWEEPVPIDQPRLTGELVEISETSEAVSGPGDIVEQTELPGRETFVETRDLAGVEYIEGVQWDSRNMVLLYLGMVARKVRKNAGYIKILDEFERQGWPRNILNNPLAGKHDSVSDQTLRTDTLRTLNKKLKYLEFCGDGYGKGIICKVLSP